MRGAPFSWFPPLRPALFAVASGLLLAAAFPPLSLGYSSCIALVPIVFALHSGAHSPRVFFKTGYLFGVAFFGTLMWWVTKLSPAASVTISWITFPATIVLVLYLALYPGLFFLMLGWIGKGRSLVMALAGTALWVIVEWFRSSGEMGFPWGAIGYALVRYPAMMQGAALFGISGVGAFVVLVNMLLSASLLAKRVRAKALFLAAGLGLLLINLFVGGRAIARFDAKDRGKPLTVALTQPNIDLAIKWEPSFMDSTFRLIDRQTQQAAAFEPGLVVFPETAAPVYVRYDPKHKRQLRELARSVGGAIFIGFLDARYDGPNKTLNVYNASALFAPDGTYAQYDKIHLLPFGEMIPFGWKFRFLQKINFGQANFQPGPDANPIPSPVGLIAPLICFESAFPGLSRRAASRGADVFVNITNDGWFGNTPGPYQHSEMAIFRAVENRRFLLRSGNTGVTMVVDPMGRVTQRLPMDREAILVGQIHHVDGKTLYTRLGNRPLLFVSLLVVVLAIATGPASRRARSSANR